MSIKNRSFHAIKWRSEFAILRGRVNICRMHNTSPKKNDILVLFDASLHSQNMGDGIIQQYCGTVIGELLTDKTTISVPTHVLPSMHELKIISESGKKIVCGTNLLTSHYEDHSNWTMPKNLYGYNEIITMGVGWDCYCDEISPVSKYVYKMIFSKTGLHSVRDSYTEKKFHQMGIHNVVNTGCPTLWRLSKNHCAAIPTHKAKNVVTTITDYNRSIKHDCKMLKILLEEYEKVFVWIQGAEDFEYLKQLIPIEKVDIIPNSIEKYTKVLREEEVDYVGTRLHAGIHALNQGVRSLVIAIDNRAIELGRDVNLPILMREDIENELATRINAPIITKIVLPMENIVLWKRQFMR